jgi:hypothetical protein
MYSSSKSNKSGWITFVFILCGIVVGGIIGEYVSSIKYLEWLGYTKIFGLIEPIVLDLSVIVITFAIKISISIAGVIGMVSALIISKKIY